MEALAFLSIVGIVICAIAAIADARLGPDPDLAGPWDPTR